MDDDEHALSVRIAQLFVLQLLVTPVVFLIVRNIMPTLFSMLLVTALVALTASVEWAPPNMAAAVFAAVLLPFIGSLLGLGFGLVISHVFDNFVADDTEMRSSGSRSGLVAQVILLAITLVLVGAHVVVIAVPKSALIATIIVHMVLAAFVFGAMFAVSVRTVQFRRAVVLYGIIYVISFGAISLIMVFSNSLFWTFFTAAIVYVVGVITAFVASMIFSNDVRAVLSNVVGGTSPPPMQETPPNVPAASNFTSFSNTTNYTPVVNNVAPAPQTPSNVANLFDLFKDYGRK